MLPQRRETRRRTLYHAGFLVCAALIIWGKRQRRPRVPAKRQVQDTLRACSVHVKPVSVRVHDESASRELQIMLAHVDHIFLVSFETCQTRLSTSLSTDATCVQGKLIDACAPQEMISGSWVHAMKVTFTHAVILQIALDKRYKHIAILLKMI